MWPEHTPLTINEAHEIPLRTPVYETYRITSPFMDEGLTGPSIFIVKKISFTFVVEINHISDILWEVIKIHTTKILKKLIDF